jgi:hypothetical protein
MGVKFSEFVFERFKFFLDVIFVVHEFLPEIGVLFKLMEILGLGSEVGFRSDEEFMEGFEFMDASFLEVSHEHVLPEDDDFAEGLFERAVVEDDAADGVGGFDLLDLFGLGVGVFDLLSELADVSPVFVDGFGDELFFLLVFPEER